MAVISCNDDDTSPNDGHTNGINVPDGEFSSEQVAIDSEGNTYSIGFDQVSNINQDPFIHKQNADGETVWRLRYEETPVDGRGRMIAFLNDRLWAVFSVDGGSNASEYISRHQTEAHAFDGVYLSGYGRGGGPVVNVLCEINPATGKIIRGSFLRAQLDNGNTNTKRIVAIGWIDGNVGIKAESAAWPAGIGTSFVKMPNITNDDRVDGAFQLYYEMDDDFNEILVAGLRDID